MDTPKEDKKYMERRWEKQSREEEQSDVRERVRVKGVRMKIDSEEGKRKERGERSEMEEKVKCTFSWGWIFFPLFSLFSR